MNRSLLFCVACLLFAAAPHATASAGWTVTNLHPAGASDSSAHGVSGGQQVGSAEVGGDRHAGLWSGTAASWVDLNPAPAGSSYSQAFGVSGGQQVGYAKVGGTDYASLWSGTAESWGDLDALLPAGYSGSEAWGVFTSGVETWVAGSAHNTSLDREEAFLWHYVPEPSTILALLCGLGGVVWRKRK